MIIRLNSNVVFTTSKQVVINDCCDNPLPHLEGERLVFKLSCLTCGTQFASIHSATGVDTPSKPDKV